MSSLALVHSHNILSVNDHSGPCVSFLLEDPGWCGLLEILFDSCTALKNTHRTNIRRLWRNASRLMGTEPTFLGSRWAYGIKGLLHIHIISRNVFLCVMFASESSDEEVEVNKSGYRATKRDYSGVKPPGDPPPALAAPLLCNFSPTFFCTSLNLATHLSMQTLSPLFKSPSAYRVLIHLL
jgi:hypothetical protein